MARLKKTSKVSKAPTSSSTEMREWYEKNKAHIENFKKATSEITKLKDTTKSTIRTIHTFSKEELRTYLKNIGSSERQLRNLSRYLYYRCQPYYRLIMYNATMFDLNSRTVIPPFVLNKSNNRNKTLKSYADTLKVVDNMGLQRELLKALIACFREDIFYGVVYYDDAGMFILPIDPDFCRISGIFQTGDLSYDMDMSYFRSRQAQLEYWGEPFVSMYNQYLNDQTNMRWQTMPPAYSICLKFRFEDWDLIVPPYSGLLNSIINLVDLEDIQAIADEQEIYKMIWLELETITGSKIPDDWKIDPSIVIEYFNRMINEALPDYISAAIVPGKLESISFDSSDKSNDVSKISKSTEALFNSSGGSQILNSSTVSGTTAFLAAIRADTEMALSTLLPQIESWVNRFLTYHVSNPSKVKFFEISTYTKDEFKKQLRDDLAFGIPVKLAINTLNGYSEADTLAMNFLEEDILKLSDKLVPPQTAYTRTGTMKQRTAGGQTKDADELTDAGEETRENKK